MIKICRGSRRIVFLFKSYAIKIPNFTDSTMWLFGRVENLVERYWYCADGKVSDMSNYPDLAKIHWADRFGLILIQERLESSFSVSDEKFEKDLSVFEEKWKNSRGVSDDNKRANFGYRNGHLVKLDYGYFGLTNWYYGRKVIKKKRLF